MIGKSVLRKEMSELRNKISTEQKFIFDEAIYQKLFDLIEEMGCEEIFTYVSFRSEIDTKKMIKSFLKMNKKIYAPKVMDKEMEFYQIKDLSSLQQSNYGIYEPDERIHSKFSRIHCNNNSKVMILPGLAFDYIGNRIGYGAGYYDRYLETNHGIPWIKIALAYDFQLLDRIKQEEYDQPVDIIITPDSIIICNEDRKTYWS